MLSNLLDKTVDRVGEWNPQLGRELKGRLNILNIGIVSVISILWQFLILVKHRYESSLEKQYNHYCKIIFYDETGSYKSSFNESCPGAIWANIERIQNLWWFDIFTITSCAAVFALLIFGGFNLINNLGKEKKKSTLNFIRLTPQSATTILVGKLLGVPVLGYIGVGLMLPLNLIAGLNADIPLSIMLGFYLTVVVSCTFFYSAALLYSLLIRGLGIFEPVLFTIGLFIYLEQSFSQMYNFIQYDSFDWFQIINPIITLPHLGQYPFLSPHIINYINSQSLSKLTWYGISLWNNTPGFMAFTLCNNSIWIYWLWQGIKRHYNNPNATLVSKQHSYGITACFVAINLGFALQPNKNGVPPENFYLMLGFNIVLLLVLIQALTNSRQYLLNWVQDRHHSNNKMNLWQDLLKGECSPLVVALMVNLLIMNLYLVPTILLLEGYKNKGPMLISLLIISNIILLYGSISQLLLLRKKNNYLLFFGASMATLIVLPLLGAAVLSPKANFLFLFSVLPAEGVISTGIYAVIVAVGIQWLSIVLINVELVKLLSAEDLYVREHL